MAKLPEQGALGLSVALVELPQLAVEQVVEEQRAVFGAVGRRDFWIKPAPPLGFLAGHKRPTDGRRSRGSGLGRFCVRQGWECLLFGSLDCLLPPTRNRIRKLRHFLVLAPLIPKGHGPAVRFILGLMNPYPRGK